MALLEEHDRRFSGKSTLKNFELQHGTLLVAPLTLRKGSINDEQCVKLKTIKHFLFTRCATISNKIHKKQKVLQAADSFYSTEQEGQPTTACIM